MTVVGLAVAVVGIVAVLGTGWGLTRGSDDVASATIFSPTLTTVGIYLGLVVAATLSLTGLQRFRWVEVLSYLLAAPWHAFGWLAEPADPVLSLASLGWSLVLLVLTLAYLYGLAAVLTTAASRLHRSHRTRN